MNKLMLIPLLLAVFAAPAFAYISITQESPLGSGTTYYTKNLSVNFTISTDGTLDKCWRFNDNTFTGSQPNISIVNCQNTSYIAYPYNNYFWLWANNTAGEVNCSTYGWSEACDTPNWFVVSPTAVGFLNMSSPKNITYQYPQDVDLNFTPVFNLSGITGTCDYSLDGGGWASLGDCYSNLSLSGLSEAQHDVQTRMEVDGSGGANDYMLSPDVFFTLGNVPDNTPPVVAIQSPTGNYYSTVVPLNFTASDDVLVDTCKYELDGSANVTIPSCANTSISADYGSHAIKVWANDTSDNYGYANSSFSVLDNISPEVSIQSPSGTVTSPFDVNYTASDDVALDFCWYSMDGGSNVSIPSCANFTDSGSSGDHNLTVYANDTSGNIGSNVNAFTIMAPPAPRPITGSTAAVIGLIIFLLAVGMILIAIRMIDEIREASDLVNMVVFLVIAVGVLMVGIAILTGLI